MKLDRVALLGMVALSAISTDLYLSGIPLIVEDFNASNADGQLTLGIFIIGISIGQIIYGPLSDFYGRKPVVYIGLFIYILASLACALAMSIEQLLLARLFQALAAASGPVIARAIVADLYSPRDGAKIMSILTASMALIPTIAPIIGSWLLYIFDWRSQFYLLAIVGVTVLCSAFSLPESSPRQQGQQLSFARIGRQFVVSIKNPVFFSYSLIGSAHFGAMFSWISIASFVVIEQFSVQPENFGYTFAIVVLGYVSGAALNSRMVARFGLLAMITAGLVTGTFSTIMILLIALLQINSLALVLCAVFGIFLAGGLCLSNTQVASMSIFPESVGQASSVFGCLQYALAAVTGTILGQFYDGTLMPLAIAVCAMSSISWLCWMLIRGADRKDLGRSNK